MDDRSYRNHLVYYAVYKRFTWFEAEVHEVGYLTYDDYRRALATAIREYDALGAQRQDVDKRLAEVMQTIGTSLASADSCRPYRLDSPTVAASSFAAPACR